MVKLPGLRAARLRRAMTQGELAEAAEISRATVNGIEAGKDAAVRTLRRLADALRVEPATLIDEAQEPRRKAAA